MHKKVMRAHGRNSHVQTTRRGYEILLAGTLIFVFPASRTGRKQTSVVYAKPKPYTKPRESVAAGMVWSGVLEGESARALFVGLPSNLAEPCVVRSGTW